MMQRTTLVLTAVLLGLITSGRTELGIAASGIRIGQATPFATLAADVKFPEGIAADADGRIYVSTFNVPIFIVKLGPGLPKPPLTLHRQPPLRCSAGDPS